LEEEKKVDFKFVVAVLIDYIRSLSFVQIPVQHYIYELVIELLVRNKRFYQLHQFLQYHVIGDSVAVACQLLSLEHQYPPAYQLALDMLKRQSSPEQIVEVFLLRNQLLAALRFLRSHKDLKVSSVRFLEAAVNTKDNTLFYTVYKFFEQRKELQGCDKFTQMYKELYQNSSKG